MNHQRIPKGDLKSIGNPQRLSEESLGGFLKKKQRRNSFREAWRRFSLQL